MAIRRFLLPLVLAPLAALPACDQQGAYGDTSSIVLATTPELWGEIEDSVYRALEPTIWTVRDEKTFTVTYQDPADALWGNLRKFTQMLLVGSADEPWVAEALDEAGRDDLQAPAIVQVNDVWARGQLVTILVLPPGGGAQAVFSQLDELAELYDRQYRQWALARMYVSGRDTALADTLADQAGFAMVLPEVYYWDRRDSVYVFRNDNPDPSELIRQVTVTWRSPMTEGVEGEDLLAWRADLAEAHYSYPQVVDLSNAQAEALDYDGHEAYQIQAVWQNPPESGWPGAGPFILRAVRCPEQDRLYLLDAWLYAPGKEKYEYMLQLETILDSFVCES